MVLLMVLVGWLVISVPTSFAAAWLLRSASPLQVVPALAAVPGRSRVAPHRHARCSW